LPEKWQSNSFNVLEMNTRNLKGILKISQHFMMQPFPLFSHANALLFTPSTLQP